jgi:hypothetical protein
MDRFLAAYADTVQGDTDLLVVTDDDDQDAYAGLALPDRASMTVLPRMWLTPKLNAVCVPAAERYRAVGFLADDCAPQAPGWDLMLAEALATPGIAYPEDRRRDDIPEHPFVSSEIVTALGWFFEPSLVHYYADHVLADIGRSAGCLRYVRDALVPHLHYHVPGTGAERDRTYAEAERNGPADYAAYQAWRMTRMGADAATVRAVAGTRPGAPDDHWHPPARPATREAAMEDDTYVANRGFVTDAGDGRAIGVKKGDRFPEGHPVLRAGHAFFTLVPGTGRDPDPGPAVPAAPAPDGPGDAKDAGAAEGFLSGLKSQPGAGTPAAKTADPAPPGPAAKRARKTASAPGGAGEPGASA